MSSPSESGVEWCALVFSLVAMAHAGCEYDSSRAGVGIGEDPIDDPFRPAQLEDAARHPGCLELGKTTPPGRRLRTDSGEEIRPCETQRPEIVDSLKPYEVDSLGLGEVVLKGRAQSLGELTC